MLLERLDSDPNRAGEKYEHIRDSIKKVFESRGCHPSDYLADETFNRVARRISEGAEIDKANISAYIYGVARNVAREHLRGPDINLLPIDGLSRSQHPAEGPGEMSERQNARDASEQGLDCLDRCFDKLPPAARDLILAYYDVDKGEQIEYRKQLAESLGLTTNGLRIRVHRIREKLEKCVEKCLENSKRDET